MLAIFDRWCSSLDVFVIIAIGLFFIVTGYRPPWWQRMWHENNDTLNCKKQNVKTVCDIPGPFTIPILGTRWIYTWLGEFRLEKVHECYRQMFQKYGNIICERALWNLPIVSVKHRKDIELVLLQNSKYPMRPPTEVISYYRTSRPDRYASVGLVNEQGEAWHKLRNALTPELVSAKTIAQFVPTLNEIVDDFITLIRRMRNDSTNHVNNVEELTNRMGLESSCALILGRRMGFLDGSMNKTATQLANAVHAHFCASRDTYYGLPFWKLYKTYAYTKLTKCEDTIYNIISEMVDIALAEQLETCDVDDAQSVFVSMLQAHNIDIREKKATIIDFIAAGIQTLGNTLVFLLHLIGKHQDVQHKLYNELTMILGSNRNIDTAALSKATYMAACIDECFRVLPTANCIARILESDINLSGYNVTAGTVVLCHTGLACLDETNFDDANCYKPERWLDISTVTETKAASRCLVVPFGIGRRICPGKRFIRQELQLVLAKVVREFDIVHEDELELQFEFLISPQPPVNITFRDRY